MVTKMKMFGILSQNKVVNKSPAPFASSAPTPSAQQFNMASIMKTQSSGCKSCRG